ncbi:hypothetical protein B296_00037855 [Ensete ventricosum]|uniref:J domain-containing protein n=1 Tax=Ensete ventricosum TaxID=4639 RepID=A0A426ZTR7_ENSVE|nr:hypothetical protein B296_00037855 [Ensete ventricosum]
MEDSRSRSGGRSEQSAGADVLGDRPRRGAPFADRLGDYAEIFADHAGSISIPFLDLPPALDGFDAAAPVRTRGAGFDYSDVFGGVDSGESAALHDELFAAPKLEETCSSKGSTFEVEVSSAAAASVAAVKEAMELAQAKLKSAKKLMERKHGILWNSRKLGHHESMKYKEQKLCETSLSQEDYDEMLVASERRQEVTSTAKLPTCDEMKEKVKFTEEEGKARHVNDLNSSKLLSRSADKYNELVSSENHILIEEVSEREDFMRKIKIMTIIGEINQNERTNDTLACQTESNRKLQKHNAAPVVCVHEDNANLEAHVSHMEEVEKPGEVHKLHIQEEVTKTPYAGEENTHVDKEENSKLKAALGKSGAAKPQSQNYSKEIDISNIAPVPGKGEDKFNMAIATVVEEEMDVEVPCVSCVSKGEGRLAASKCTDSEKTRREEKQCDAENVNRSEGMMVVHEQKKREELNMKQQKCLSAENEITFKEDKEADELEEVLKKWKTSVGATTLEDQEKLIKATKAAFWLNYDGNNPKETQFDLQQWDKKKDATPEPYHLENFEGQNKYEKERARLSKEAKEIEWKMEEEELAKLFEKEKDSIMKEEEEQAKLFEEAIVKIMKVEVARVRSLEEAKERDRKEEEERARLLEEEKKRERKLEEEDTTRLLEEAKERERGREKDRLAVERAIHEAHERAFTEARERAERMAVERITSEARQRALKEAQEKAKKTSCDALEKSLTEKASRDATLRAERALVERATAEVRERAVDRALAVKVAADAREHAERYNATSRDTTRKENILRDGRMEKKEICAAHGRFLLPVWGEETSPCVGRRNEATGWQPIQLTDVITSSAVKKAYRRATLCVHPDKLQQRGASIQQKYICEKVFDLLKVTG